MKKLAIATACLLMIVGCQPKESAPVSTSQPASPESGKTNGSQSVQVDKALLDVEVTLPASYFKNQDVDQVIEKAKADGVKEAKKNPDGSVTYKMSKSAHSEMMKQMEKGITDQVADLKSGKNFKSIKDVTFNNKFSEFTLTVDKQAFEGSFDSLATLGIGITAMYYQMFDGVSSDKLKVNIQLKDQATNNIFNTVVYPDAMDKMNQK